MSKSKTNDSIEDVSPDRSPKKIEIRDSECLISDQSYDIIYKGSEIVLIPYIELSTMKNKILWKIDSKHGFNARLQPKSNKISFRPGADIVLKNEDEKRSEFRIPPLLFDPVYRDSKWLKAVAEERYT